MKNNEAASKTPKKAKKKKAPKAAKAKKVQKVPKEPRDPSEKRGIPKILLIILPVVLVLAIAVVAVYLIFFRTPEDEVDKIAKNLEAYVLGEDQVTALEQVVAEGVVTRTSVETPTEDGPQEWTYHYRQLTETPSKVAAAYMDLLRSEEEGFVLTDRDNHELEEEPNMDAKIGSVILERDSVENAAAAEDGEDDSTASDPEAVDRILRVVLAWSESAVAIQVSKPEGQILPPVVEEVGTTPIEPVALKAQLEYFNNLPAGKLGLPGDSMAEYRVYPVEGWVRVSGVTCRVMNVYVIDMPEETNTFVGTYYLSSDNTQLFKLDASGAIVSVDLS